MSRNNSEEGFSLDDMMEIFGDSVESAPKKAPAAVAPAAAPAPAPGADQDDESLSDDEMAILEAYEKSKKEQKVKDIEATRKKEEEARRILEEYERGVREAQERESLKKKEQEEKQKREIEELKKKDQFVVDQKKLEDEERKIIEEFERQARVDKEKEDLERRAKEDKAQQELKALADTQKAEDESRLIEEKKRDEEFQKQAVAAQVAADRAGEKKESRLMELLAKAKAELEDTGPPPMPGVAAAAAPAAPTSSAKDFLIDIEAKEADAFCHMLDESRKAMFTFLAPMIGIKAANNMLNKTVERARAKAPIVLKDVNWRVDGSLREDGSVDTDRIYKNVQGISVATRADDFVAGLKELTQLRIKAVEVGLGAKASQDMKAKIYSSRPAMAGKNHKKEWIDYFFSAVVG